MKDLVIRPATTADLASCLALGHTCSTDYVWQMALEARDGAIGVTFRAAWLAHDGRIE